MTIRIKHADIGMESIDELQQALIDGADGATNATNTVQMKLVGCLINKPVWNI